VGTYLEFDGLPLHFDAVTKEQTKHTAKVTEHPVEEGANVSDHIRDELDTVTLEVFVTNQPIKDVNGIYDLDLNYIELIEVDGKDGVLAGKSLDVPKYRPVPITPGAAIQAIGNAVRDLMSDATVAQLYGQTSTKKLIAAAPVQNWPTKFNAITDTVAQLVDWKMRGVVGKVITPWKTFPAVAITDVGTARDAPTGDAAIVSLTFKEIRLVESKLVTAPVPTEPRGNTQKAKGRQPTSFVREPVAKKKTLLKKITE
jgi:hypothetical protein